MPILGKRGEEIEEQRQLKSPVLTVLQHCWVGGGGLGASKNGKQYQNSPKGIPHNSVCPPPPPPPCITTPSIIIMLITIINNIIATFFLIASIILGFLTQCFLFLI